MKNKPLFNYLSILHPIAVPTLFFAAYIKALATLVFHLKDSALIFTGFTEKTRNGLFSKVYLYPGIINFQYQKTNIT